MPAKKKSSSAKRTSSKAPASKAPEVTLGPWQRLVQRVRSLTQRRPHRSFRLTRKRDYARSLALPGYWAFAGQVLSRLWQHRTLFAVVALFYAGMGILLGNMTSQDTYDQINELLHEGGEGLLEGQLGAITQATLLSLVAINGASQTMTDVQQVYAVLLFLLIWMTTVWLLRELLAGNKPRARDGFYNASSPLVSTVLVTMVLLVQLVPIGLLAVAYSALSGIGVLSDGLGVFLFSMVALPLIVLTLYWVTSTFIALVVVTLPGMYPMRAIRVAGDLAIGRRLRIAYRLLWLGVTVIVPWLLIMTPIVLIDGWLRDMWAWYAVVPLVPICATILGALMTVWAASYVYILYRKVVDDSAPA